MNPLLTKLSASTVAAVMLLSPAFALASHGEVEHSSRGATVTNSGQSAKHGDDEDKKEGAEHRATVRNNGKSEKHGSGIASTTPVRDRDEDHDEECEHGEYHTATTTVSWQDHGNHHKKHATTTPPVATTTIPVISGITASPATSTATIAWQTNVPASGTVYYGTTTPDVNATSTLSVSTTTLSTGHSFSLTGLTASTTYYFIVKSANAAGAAISSLFSFITSALSNNVN